MLGGAALARALVDVRMRRRPGPGVWAAFATVAAVHAAGLVGGAADDEESGLETVRVAVLQGNIDQGVKWSPAWAGEILGIYEDLTRSAAAEGAQIVVWPETSVPGGIDADAPPARRLAALGRETGTVLVLGAVGLEYDGGPIGQGITRKEGMEQPVWVYVPSIAPSDLVIYQGEAFSAWKGNFLIGSLAFAHLNRLVLRDGAVVAEERLGGGLLGRIRSIAVDAGGFIYLGSDGGDIWRLRPE